MEKFIAAKKAEFEATYAMFNELAN
jgi:hypothetical protein